MADVARGTVLATSRPEIVTLGEVLAAFVATTAGPLAEATAFERHVAGAEANVAVGLARLGHSSAFIGRVGADGLGTAAIRRLRGEGVDVRAMRADPDARTGVLIRERRALGAAEVLYHRSGSAGSRLSVDDIEAARSTIEAARWLHLTGITPGLSAGARAAVRRAIALARGAGLTVSLDVNLRRRLWSDGEAAPVLQELVRDVDVVLASPDEARVVAGDADEADPARLAAALLDLGPALAVLKLGPDGALASGHGEGPCARPALPVPGVIDPVGAGDAFCAGFIAARLEGLPLERVLDVANACGASAVAATGDQPGLPDRLELGRLLAAMDGARADDTMR